jgi:nuclear GTP-binding protein
VENVKDPENHVQAVLERVRPEHLMRHYSFVKSDGTEGPWWTDADEFMTKIATASGRLLKGGEPDIPTVAKMVLNDFQRGNLPHYVSPPGCETESTAGVTISVTAGQLSIPVPDGKNPVAEVFLRGS